MSRKYQNWTAKDDTKILRLRSEGKTWGEVAEHFDVGMAAVYVHAKNSGLFEARRNRRFGADEDALIRAAYVAQRDLAELARQLGRTHGDIRQRLQHHHKDLLNTVRTPHGSVALKRYGASLLDLGATPAEALTAMRRKLVDAKAAARLAAIEAKQKRANEYVNSMHQRMAEGMSRDAAIFEARACGLTLERIGSEFSITRERVRQICDQYALDVAVKASLQNQVRA